MQYWDIFFKRLLACTLFSFDVIETFLSNKKIARNVIFGNITFLFPKRNSWHHKLARICVFNSKGVFDMCTYFEYKGAFDHQLNVSMFTRANRSNEAYLGNHLHFLWILEEYVRSQNSIILYFSIALSRRRIKQD